MQSNRVVSLCHRSLRIGTVLLLVVFSNFQSIRLTEAKKFIAPKTPSSTPATRIVGGQMDASDSATYQISMQALAATRRSPTKYHHFCSGSIVTTKHVLTAAHCLTGWQTSEVSIVAGTKVWDHPDGVRRSVDKLEIHDKFQKLNGHDIGLVTVTEPFVFSAKVRMLVRICAMAICVLSIRPQISSIAFDDAYVEAGRDVVLTGWGYTLPIRDSIFLPQWIHAYFKSYPKELQITHLRTISNAECRRKFWMQLETELCTYKWGTGACSVSCRS